MLQSLLLSALLVGGQLAAPSGDRQVLVFHKQNGFVHESTAFAVSTLSSYMEKHGLRAETSEDGRVFTTGNLGRYSAVVFLNTNYRNGPLLTSEQEAAFEGYIHQGGGFVGIHGAVPLNGEWEETQWPWYARLFGGRFQNHGPYRLADLVIETDLHPSTATLPKLFSLGDEWYEARETPSIRVLTRIHENGPGLPGLPSPEGQPMSWCQEFEGGRSWVTLVGHDESAFRDPHYLAHVLGGILWSTGWNSLSLPVETPSPRGQPAWRLTRRILPDGEFSMAFTNGLQIRTPVGRLKPAGVATP